jgi:hypothetical protein
MALTNFDVVKGASMGTYTVVAADDTANTKTIALKQLLDSGQNYTGFIVQIIRAGKVVSSDPSVSLSSNNLVIADGTTYVLTTGDVINYIVY